MAAIGTEARPGSKVAKMKIENDWPVVVLLPLAAVQTTLGFFSSSGQLEPDRKNNFCSCLGGWGRGKDKQKSIFPIRVKGGTSFKK